MKALDTKVTVVVVNYNAGTLLKKCVDLCMVQVAQVVVVDNASTDGSLASLDLSLEKGGNFKLIKNTNNLGFAVACNQGTEASTGDFVLYLNPDCLAWPGAVGDLVTAMQAAPQAGMAGGLLLNPDGSEQVGGRRFVPTPWRSLVRVLRLESFESRWPKLFQNFNLHKHPLPDGAAIVEAISGACIMVRRSDIASVGSWDEGYFLHCEDLDLCMRYRQEGLSILFVPTARFTHHRGTSSRSRPLFVEWHKHRGMVRFYGKFFRHQYPGALWPVVLLGVWTRFAAIALKIFIQYLLPWRSLR